MIAPKHLFFEGTPREGAPHHGLHHPLRPGDVAPPAPQLRGHSAEYDWTPPGEADRMPHGKYLEQLPFPLPPAKQADPRGQDFPRPGGPSMRGGFADIAKAGLGIGLATTPRTRG
eukprot:gene5306-biopygen10252